MSKKKIIVVDDDQFWLQLICRQLTASGYDVQGFTNANEAIDEIDTTHSAVVVDMLLGYNTVLPLLHEIQTDKDIADLPIVVCSNIADSVPREALREYGVVQVVDKTSMKLGDLERAVKRVAV